MGGYIGIFFSDCVELLLFFFSVIFPFISSVGFQLCCPPRKVGQASGTAMVQRKHCTHKNLTHLSLPLLSSHTPPLKEISFQLYLISSVDPSARG